jgi:hypothetical protein
MKGQQAAALSSKGGNALINPNEQLQIWAGKKKPEARDEPHKTKQQQ